VVSNKLRKWPRCPYLRLSLSALWGACPRNVEEVAVWCKYLTDNRHLPSLVRWGTCMRRECGQTQTTSAGTQSVPIDD
jgi:hypothetical protein